VRIERQDADRLGINFTKIVGRGRWEGRPRNDDETRSDLNAQGREIHARKYLFQNRTLKQKTNSSD